MNTDDTKPAAKPRAEVTYRFAFWALLFLIVLALLLQVVFAAPRGDRLDAHGVIIRSMSDEIDQLHERVERLEAKADGADGVQ